MSIESFTEVMSILFVCANTALYLWFLGRFGKLRFQSSCAMILLPFCFTAITNWLLGEVWDVSYQSALLLLRQAIVLALRFLAALFFYELGMQYRLLLAVLFSAVSEAGLVLTLNLSPIFNALVDHENELLTAGTISTDLYMQHIQILVILELIALYLVAFAVTALSLRLIVRLFREKERALRIEQTVFLLIPSLSGFLTALMFHVTMYTIDEANLPVILVERYPILIVLTPVIVVLSLVTIFCGIYLFQNLLRVSEEQNARVIMEQQVDAMRRHLDEVELLNDRIRHLRHDLKNHLSVLNRLAEEPSAQAELKAYLKSLTAEIESTDRTFSCGDSVIDALLQMKYHDAIGRKANFDFKVEDFSFPKGLLIRSYDMSILLGNALDNAIEAAARVDAPFLSLSSKIKGNLFLMTVQNSFDGELVFSKNRSFPATRKDRASEHGLGFSNMKRIAERYHGGIDYLAEENIFTLNVMLQNEAPV